MPILRLLLDICLFRKGPEDVPASALLLALMVLAYLMVGLLLMSFQTGLATAIVQVGVEGGMGLLFLRLLLGLVRKPHRFVQSAVALLGSDALISLLALPLLLAQGVEWLAGAIHLPLLGMMFWHIAVSGMIFGRAMSKPFPLGVGVALLYTLLSVQVMAWLFPPTV